MATVELLKHNLAIEPDLQNFLHFIMAAVKGLGGNAFSAAVASVSLAGKLRAGGAGSGFPLPVTLTLDGMCLSVHWGENGNSMVVNTFKNPATEQAVETLRHEFQQSTETIDPAILLKRNAEMARYLDETRKRTEKEIEIMQQTLAQRQAELGESVRRAETDPLTGLYNRRAYDEKLDQAFRRVKRQNGEHLSLALLDLDFFKQINDQHGHQFGDAYLNKAAQAMLETIRGDVDMAFRIGGDEFAMLMFANGKIACKRVMDVMKAMNNKVSIGIATLVGGGHRFDNIEDFVRCADDALYQAKRSGRGRVVVDACDQESFAGCIAHCSQEVALHAKRA
ncbi:MAG: GGDEF domain-containing protein [Sulfuricella sp.]|nr:GGDEF domain-containing protein [Sulfuricella sp.]